MQKDKDKAVRSLPTQVVIQVLIAITCHKMEIVTQAVDLFFSERFCFYRNIAAVLGAAYLLYVSINLLSYLASGFNAYILAPCGITRINLKKYGSWAS